MNTDKILVPIDFTSASEQAVKQAIIISKKTGSPVALFHVTNDEPDKLPEMSQVKTDMENIVAEISGQGIICDYQISKGNIFDEISQAANFGDYLMMVIGTHGIKGIKQKLLGADMLKLVRLVDIPCLIVQQDCICRDFNPIVFPVGGHEGFAALVEATALMAKIFNSEIHFYSVRRKGDTGSQKLRENTLFAAGYFEEKGIPFKRVEEDANVFSVGFAKQTLQYADKVKAGLISMMSVKTEEYYYFAQADKESMINNEFNIPVLCSVGLIDE